MIQQPVHYAVLRDHRDWDESAKRAGLEQQEDGTLTLARLPGTLDGKPIVVPNSSAIEPSGLAAGACQDLYVADTAHHRIVRVDSLCNARAILPGAGGGGSAPGQFKDPRGLLIANDSLYVADSGNGRIQVFRLPSLELRATWENLLEQPTCLAADSQGRIYVLDSKLNDIRILRFSPSGVPDDAYNATLAQRLTGLTPLSLALDSKDTLYVTVGEQNKPNKIVRLKQNSQNLEPISGDKPEQPGVMTARGDWLYVADEASGEIWVFDCNAGLFLGPLKDYRGPITALALDQEDALYIKPGTDDTFHHLHGGVAYAPIGTLTAGPFDAGMDCVWERVHAELDLPAGTQAELHLFTAGTSVSAPAPEVFIPALALDRLVKPGRFLWLRVILRSDESRHASPLLKQVQAETTAESYMDHLPAVYRRDDAPTHFLEYWLALFRAELGDLELAMEEMPRRFDPLTAPEADLRWLASWLAFDPPADLRGDELRKLLQRVPELYDRRGTPFGIGEFVELYTGVRPAIFEAFRERHIWQLGYTSTLGFDTALAAGLPDGMIVPGHTLADPQYFGLRGDYYSGIDFQAHVLSRTDPNVDFDWGDPSSNSVFPPDAFSVRWTGEIAVADSELYTFHIEAEDGVRLWVDSQLVIDAWNEQAPTEHSNTIPLSSSDTHPITVEYFETEGGGIIKLYWSIEGQNKEIIPADFKGEYFSGIDLDPNLLLLTRTDHGINFDSRDITRHAMVPVNWFSMRWTGQVLPRFSERYTFHVLADDGVRLYVDGIPIINQWNDQFPAEHSSVISLELEAGRWYALQVEYYRKTGGAGVKLYWSSRSQPKEIIPQSQLYSVRDETAQLELAPSEAGAASMLVGQTVIGESGPLAKADFGMPLYSEPAHLFTVVVPSAAVPAPVQRATLRRVIEAEKPAHTDYHLCFIEPRMRAGFQARLGIDSIVAGPPEPLALSGSLLGVESYLGEDAGTDRFGQARSRVGHSARLGQDSHIA